MRWQRTALFTSLLFLAQVSAKADDLSITDIINALDPHTKIAPPNRSFKRGIQVQKGTSDDSKPTINLYVNFEFDSAQLTNDGQISLDTLGKALSDQRLQKYDFLIAGHTDAKGTAEYNQGLSERRAAAVRDYLVTKFHIDQLKLESNGFGSRELLDPRHPEDGVNRRVQITNVSSAN